MKKSVIAGIVVLTSLLFIACGDDCDPGQLPQDDRIVVNLKNSNGTAFLNYSNSALPDSVKVTNLSTNANVNRYLVSDSILVIEDYTKTNGAVTRFRIAKGTILKPDTIEVTVARTDINDLCGTSYNVARFGTFKINNQLKCSNCSYNTIITHTR